jgi:RNA polymerase sigma factor (sigma-70 family)
MDVRAEEHEEGIGLRDFDGFFRDHFAGVARTAALVARDRLAGQDLAQEAFIRLHERWTEMESVDHARNLVYRAAINLARSQLRRRLRLRFESLKGREGAHTIADPSNDVIGWVVMAQALSELSARQRACVVLVDYADLAPADAGMILGITADTVRVHLMRGRRALRQRLRMERSESR